VVIGLGEIDVLHSAMVDALICLNQASCDAYYRDSFARPAHHRQRAGRGGADDASVRGPDVGAGAPGRRERHGDERGGPGSAFAVSHIVSRDALEATISERVPRAHREANLKAIELGFSAAEAALAASRRRCERSCRTSVSAIRAACRAARTRQGR